ncbi:MAG: L,D-transpeptidase [Sandaracinaceae bacterium]
MPHRPRTPLGSLLPWVLLSACGTPLPPTATEDPVAAPAHRPRTPVSLPRAVEPTPQPPPDPAALARAAEAAAREAFEREYPWHGVAYHVLAQVHARADRASPVIGYLRRGSTFRAAPTVRGPGCDRGWARIPGGGYVCRGQGFQLGDVPQTFEPAPSAPTLEAALPYVYGWVVRDDVAQYWRIPSVEEEALAEAWIDRERAREEAQAAAEAAALAASSEEGPSTPSGPPGAPAADGAEEEASGGEASGGEASGGEASGGAASGGATAAALADDRSDAPDSEAPGGAEDGAAADEDADPGEAPPAPSPELEAPPGLDEEATADNEDDGAADDEDERPSVLRMRMRRGFYVSLDGVETDAGRRFYRTVRGAYVPADAVAQAEPPSHRGVVLGGGWSLPLAFVHRDGVRLLARDPVSGVLNLRGPVPRLTPLPLAEEIVVRRQRRYRVDRRGRVVREDAVRVARAIERPRAMPAGARWIHVDVSQQVLVAYEGDQPVFATLVSTGQEGHETVLGTFRIQSKHVSTTMDDTTAGPDSYSIEDVPWAQYFEGSYALHGAFWHDRFGRVRSHGCVNLAPADARWLFGWTEPETPEAWHGVRATAGRDGTWVHVTDG